MPAFRRLLPFLLLLLPAAWGGEPVSVPRYTHPGAGQTFYFLLADRFANGRTDNDRGGLAGGPEITGFDPTRISHYHGGDFAGLTAHLDYLQKLGVTAIWVTPPLKNKPMQSGTAGYHGYWITDFLQTDPHLGSNDEFRELIRQAHARGLKVFMDIIVNHTADVIRYEGTDYAYRPTATAPYCDAAGKPFDEHAVAFNGLGDPAAFPALAAERSFPYRPIVPAAEAQVKQPAWLNDVTLYHNRGNSTFAGESAIHGDFVGLDDLFTEHPRVVQGFIAVFSAWLEYGIDGYRIDTTRHVNNEFWQAFAPAIRARARELGRPDFLQFGEVYNDAGDAALLSSFSTGGVPLDTTLDFGFFVAARRFVSQGGKSTTLAEFFARDDYYTDHDSNVHATTTFLGNHDAGRFGYFLQQDNPDATPELLASLAQLGHGLLLLSRGQPVLYYGDEQGMIGRGGNDMQAREDLFASQAPDFRSAPRFATNRTGAEDKFDTTHPFYRLFSQLTALRAAHSALRTGAMLPRPTGSDAVFAFSRFDRHERIEYLAVFNRSPDHAAQIALATSQPAGALLRPLFSSTADETARAKDLTVDSTGSVLVQVPPLQFAVWRATAPLAAAAPVTMTFTHPSPQAALKFTQHEVDGLSFPSRVELRTAVTGGDGLGEVTFTLTRASRPGQVEYLGTDDAAPYRIFWSPPHDLAPGEIVTFAAVHNDLRGHLVSAELPGVAIASIDAPMGIVGSQVPTVTLQPLSQATKPGKTTLLLVAATGTAPLEYQWLRNGEEVAGATGPTLALQPVPASAGNYRVLVRNRAGTAISAAATVTQTDR